MIGDDEEGKLENEDDYEDEFGDDNSVKSL